MPHKIFLITFSSLIKGYQDHEKNKKNKKTREVGERDLSFSQPKENMMLA